MGKTADLHMHTWESDGKNTLPERVEQARRNGLDIIAITDHDTIGDHFLDAENGKGQRTRIIDGVEVLTGAELKADVLGNRVEILSYWLDPQDEAINQLAEEAYGKRVERIEEMADTLDERLSEDISAESILDREGIPGRTDVAEELVELGVVNSVQAAFDNYIGREHEAYVPTERIPAERVIETVHENGGVTSLAHPWRDLDEENIGEVLEELEKLGLDAIEGPYTYPQRAGDYSIGTDPEMASHRAVKLADEYDLGITGGSDCHGEGTAEFYIGEIHLPASHVENLRPEGKEYRPKS